MQNYCLVYAVILVEILCLSISTLGIATLFRPFTLMVGALCSTETDFVIIRKSIHHLVYCSPDGSHVYRWNTKPACRPFKSREVNSQHCCLWNSDVSALRVTILFVERKIVLYVMICKNIFTKNYTLELSLGTNAEIKLYNPNVSSIF
jgi:hypothetical protein